MQSFQTFKGRSVCATVLKPILEKKPGASVSAKTLAIFSFRARAISAWTIAFPVPGGEPSAGREAVDFSAVRSVNVQAAATDDLPSGVCDNIGVQRGGQGTYGTRQHQSLGSMMRNDRRDLFDILSVGRPDLHFDTPKDRPADRHAGNTSRQSCGNSAKLGLHSTCHKGCIKQRNLRRDALE